MEMCVTYVTIVIAHTICLIKIEYKGCIAHITTESEPMALILRCENIVCVVEME